VSLEELWRPAIRLAEDGFPVTRNVATWFAESASRIRGDPESSSIYLRSGVPPAEGGILVQRDLGRTLRRLSVGGAAEFYGGSIGEQLISCLEPLGGLMTADDLKSHGLDVYTPLHSGYRGFDIHQTAPPSQGLIHLETMNILQGVDVAAVPPLGDELIHLGVEANKLAVADRLRHVGDPLFVDYDVNLLLSDEHARRRQALIAYSAEALPSGSPAGSDTTYLCAVDRDGNAVSFIHSLSLRVGRGFTLDAGHPNCLAPGKRTMSTLNCYVVTRGGLLHAVGGTPGGDSQVQWNSQILSSLIDQQLDPARAVDKVRWTHSPSTDPATLDEPETLTIEARIPQETLAGLQRRGHPVRVVGPYAAGGDVQLIEVDRERGVLVGASDPRGDGIPIGL
jgi:gamma-glutamyltranspeptidase/glutathione hydrolase